MHTLKASDGRRGAHRDGLGLLGMGVNGRDGSVFGSSYTQGTPVDQLPGGVVPGFQKAIAGQKVGSTVAVAMIVRRRLPRRSARGGGIQPGDSLVFRDRDPQRPGWSRSLVRPPIGVRRGTQWSGPRSTR